MTDQQEIWAEAYRRNLLTPEKKALYEEAMRRGMVEGPERTFGQRLLDNLGDGFWRSGAGFTQRQFGDSNANGLDWGDVWGHDDNDNGWDPSDLGPKIRPGSPIDRLLDATLGDARGYLRTTTALSPAAQRERERRERYEALATADPIDGAGDAAAFLLGQIGGAGLSPESWVAPASGAVRGTGARAVAGAVARRAGANAGVNAAVDVALQAGDISGGVQDDYSLLQTGGAAVLGAGFSVAGDTAVRPVADFVRRSFTDPVTPRVEPEPVIGADGVATPPPAPPEFGIVQPISRRTPLLDAVARAREGQVPQMIGETLARAYTAVVSDQHPLIRAVEDIRSGIEARTGEAVDLAPSQDPRMLTRGRFDWAAIGHQDLLHGVHAYRGTAPTTPALADVISAVSVRAKRAGEKAEDALQRFNEYMVARRSSIEWDRHARGELEAEPVSRSKADAEAFIKHIEQNDPEFRGLADAVNEYAGGLLKKKLDGGLIDKATYDASIAARDFFVPLRRVMDEGPRTGGTGAGKNAASAVKRFKGSDRDVVDPISVLIEETYRLNQRLRQNELNLSFIRLAERLDAAMQAGGDKSAANRWVKKLSAPKKKINVEVDPKTIDMFDDEAGTMWRPGEINDAGKAVLYAWRNGKREAWEVIEDDWGRDVFESLAGMPKGMQDTFLNVVAAPTAVLSQTITRDPAFLFANFIRDQVSAWIVTDVGFKPGEGALGMADELRQNDLTRLYGLGGGISGGAATATMGDVLHHADTFALAQKGLKAKYLPTPRTIADVPKVIGGLLATSELSETGTRLRVFKRGFERAKREGFSEYDALIQAAFNARDMIDFGRAGSRMHYTRRLVTFLGAAVQGLDKAVRVLGADGALTRVPLKDAIAPLFGRQAAGPVRAEDAAAMKLAVKAWSKIAAISTIGLGLSALYHDDPEYQQANERMRATHWTVPWGDELVRIPKPFELAFLSNVVERGYEGTIGQDPKAWGRMVKGLGELFMPPTDIPVLAVAGGLKSNTNSLTGRPIVPDHLQELPPELQYQHWNSQFSRWLGEQIGVSPAKIDYAISGFGGPMGSYFLNGSDAADPDRPSGRWTDLPVVRRFVQPWQRGAQDQRDFYDRAGARTSELMRARNGIETYLERGRTGEARAILDELDEPGRLFVLSQMGAAPTRRLNPLERARVVAQEGSALIGELNGAQPKDDGVSLPPMSRRTRQAVEDAVERLVVSEMRNAMIATKQPGFVNREPMDRDGYWEDLRDMAPEVAAELERRLGSGRNRAYDYEAVMQAWPQVEERLRTEGPTAYLDDLAEEAQGRTRSWGERVDSGEEEASALEMLGGG